ncbi:MAG: hypothetical protein N3D11_06365 [Candidatus Sumerlaeia bacterium]|nr:hypothetical protein [Candidatus Sumerlaeia bacterium]
MFALCGTCRCFGAALNVGGQGPFASIQQAVDAAAPGDEIRVAGGTYFESITVRKSLSILGGFSADHTTRSISAYPTVLFPPVGSESALLLRSRNRWMLLSTSADEPPTGQLLRQEHILRRILSAQSSESGWRLRLDSDEGISTGPAWLVFPRGGVFQIARENTTDTAVSPPTPLRVHLDGLQIAGGLAGEDLAGCGGAVHATLDEGDELVVSRCEIQYSRADRAGGAMFLALTDGAKCRITSNVLTCNDSDGSTESVGGALAIRASHGCEVVCAGNTFLRNSTAGEGGALDIAAEAGCRIHLLRNRFANNRAGQNGGALTVRLAFLSALECLDNRMENNEAIAGSCGAAYYELDENVDATIAGERLLANQARLAAGALGFRIGNGSACMLSALQVSGNTAADCGGILAVVETDSQLQLADSLIQANLADVGNHGALDCRIARRSVLEIGSTTFLSNNALGNCGVGQLIADEASTVSLGDCDIAFNGASGRCGGLRVIGRNQTAIRFQSTHFAVNNAKEDNGAIHCSLHGRSSMGMRDCVFERNEAGRHNGVGEWLATDEAVLAISGCQFQGNLAHDGSNGVGVFEFHEGSPVRWDQCRWEFNRSAQDAGVGRFAFLDGAWAEFSDCVFADNETSGSGGAGYLRLSDDSAAAFRRCEIVRNTAWTGPLGAFEVEAYSGSLVVLDETRFEDNGSSGPYGALRVYCEDGTALSISDCEWTGNRANGGAFGACAVEAIRDSPISIHATTVTENLAGSSHGGLFISLRERSPLNLYDCRFHHNSAVAGNGGTLTILADNQCSVSLWAVHCWANRAHGDAGAVWIASQNHCWLEIEESIWSGNLAWYERTEAIVLTEADSGRWVAVPVSGDLARPEGIVPAPGDLITQGSRSWVVGETDAGPTSVSLRLDGPERPQAGRALLRRVLGDSGAFVIDHRRGGACLIAGLQASNNRAGRDQGAGRIVVSDIAGLQLQDCVFRENQAGRLAGAVALNLARADDIVIQRSAFLDNTAGQRDDLPTGGFCGAFDLLARDCRLLLSRNRVAGNRALAAGQSGGHWGGGLLDVEQMAEALLIRNEVRDNRADRDVGGLEVGCTDLSAVTLRDNVFVSNRAGRDFGALVVGADGLSPIVVDENEFQSNVAAGCGGALGFRPSRGPEGLLLTENSMQQNIARLGCAACLLGPFVSQDNTISRNPPNRNLPSQGAVAVLAAGGSFLSDTFGDNRHAAIVGIGGSIEGSAQLLASLASDGNRTGWLLETTSPALAVLLPAARYLPLYLIQDRRSVRILDAEELTADESHARRQINVFVQNRDALSIGECRVATEWQCPVTIMRGSTGWLIQAQAPLPESPAAGMRIVQNDVVRHLGRIIEPAAGSDSSSVMAMFDDDTSLSEGPALLASPPLDPAVLEGSNLLVWGSDEMIHAIGEVRATIRNN